MNISFIIAIAKLHPHAIREATAREVRKFETTLQNVSVRIISEVLGSYYLQDKKNNRQPLCNFTETYIIKVALLTNKYSSDLDSPKFYLCKINATFCLMAVFIIADSGQLFSSPQQKPFPRGVNRRFKLISQLGKRNEGEKYNGKGFFLLIEFG